MYWKFMPEMAPNRVGGMNTVATIDNQRALAFRRRPMNPMVESINRPSYSSPDPAKSRRLTTSLAASSRSSLRSAVSATPQTQVGRVELQLQSELLRQADRLFSRGLDDVDPHGASRNVMGRRYREAHCSSVVDHRKDIYE